MTVITALVYFAGSLVCHQIADRSFHISGIQLPVCARCTGLYLGAAAGLVASFAPLVAVIPSRTALIVAAMPTIVTLATAAVGLWDPGNAVRAAFAAPLGFVVGAIVTGVATRRLR